MKIALAQLCAERGEVATNTRRHLSALKAAAGADWVLFPEPSLTAYEPSRAAALAMPSGDERLAVFQQAADAAGLCIGVGVPLRVAAGISIGMVLFRPERPRSVYCKAFLHESEKPFFVETANEGLLIDPPRRLAAALCYELSNPAHAPAAARQGARVYMAATLNTAAGVNKDAAILQAVGRRLGWVTGMVNAVGPCEYGLAAGGTACWDRKGHLLQQLSPTEEALLLLDTETLKTQSVAL